MAESIETNTIIEEEEDTQKDKFLIFGLGNESYGIEIRNVIEIIGLQPVTQVPEMPSYIMGIINLRGKIIPVMDVRLRFNKEFREYNDRTCVIVTQVNDVTVGLVIDSVSEVLSIPGQDIVQPPEFCGDVGRYVNGIGNMGENVVMLLDCRALLDEVDSEKLENII